MQSQFQWRCRIKLADAIILFVDDEPALRDIFARWLTAIGCGTVKTAKDGVDALAVLANGSIDLLITDVRMPIMDGVGLVRQMAESANRIPSVIFLSGFGDVDKREMYSLGAEAFVAKPFDRKDLLGIIERALAERSTLWQSPAPTAPRQVISIVVDTISSDSCENALCLGRGGFCATYTEAVSLGTIAFECYITSQQRKVTGQGYVRWKSATDHKLGIEFTYIDPTSRPWIFEEINAFKPRCFIPAG